MAAVRNENQYIDMGFNGRFLCDKICLMFSGVLISFLWSICNLELKLESYDHFEGKKLSEYTLFMQYKCWDDVIYYSYIPVSYYTFMTIRDIFDK